MPSAPDKELIRARALQLGAYRCGFAIADVVAEPQRRIYAQWIADGKHGTMDYCARYSDVRDDPRLLLPGAQTVISCAFYYDTGVRNPHIATYALGADYHYVLKHRLAQLGDWLTAQYGGEYRALVDTAPMRERYWAQQAGIGFIGLNNHLIIPGAGSYFFLAELLWTIAVPPDKSRAELSAAYSIKDLSSLPLATSDYSPSADVSDMAKTETGGKIPFAPSQGVDNRVGQATSGEQAPAFGIGDKAEPATSGEATIVDAAAMRAACEQCRACVRACPNAALDGNGGCDARRCISYLTIEHRGDLPEYLPTVSSPAIPAVQSTTAQAQKELTLAGQIYGCDICQQVCHHNRPSQLSALSTSQSYLIATQANVASSVTVVQSLTIESVDAQPATAKAVTEAHSAEGAQQAAEAQPTASAPTAAAERPVSLPEFAANPEIASLGPVALSQMTPSHYKRLTSKSALRRAPFPQLLRNLLANEK